MHSTVSAYESSRSGAHPASFHTFKRGKTYRHRSASGQSPRQHARAPEINRGPEGFADAQTDVPLGIPKGAMCVQRLDDSLNSAIHINYRVSLRSSSMREPRDPLLKVLYVIRLRSQTFLLPVQKEFSSCAAGRLTLPADEKALPKQQREFHIG
jgi:hypothetical protein